MTHDELLARLWEKRNSLCDNLDVYFALSAVVKLHKPQFVALPNGDWKANCTKCDGWEYPCPTIQAIEKELR
jgi:hypothetical protein